LSCLDESDSEKDKGQTCSSTLLRPLEGAYTHPKVIAETIDFIQHYGPIKFLSGLALDGSLIPKRVADKRSTDLASWFRRVTYGGVLSGTSVRLYRHNATMLTSVPNFWPGYVGMQTFPWMAVVHDLAIWTQSGRVTSNWLRKSGLIANTHLPMVTQESNVALIVYKPLQPMPLRIWADVALYWRDKDFDQLRTIQGNGSNQSSIRSLVSWVRHWLQQGRRGSWIAGQRGNSYVAVYRPCGARKRMGWYSCPGELGRQAWAIVVGDASRHGSFDSFCEVIATSRVEQKVRRRPWVAGLKKEPLYVASLTMDNTSLRHEW
jgi:hypothetical protein